jgi:hypothetical protein
LAHFARARSTDYVHGFHGFDYANSSLKATVCPDFTLIDRTTPGNGDLTAPAAAATGRAQQP